MDVLGAGGGVGWGGGGLLQSLHFVFNTRPGWTSSLHDFEHLNYLPRLGE